MNCDAARKVRRDRKDRKVLRVRLGARVKPEQQAHKVCKAQPPAR